MTQSWSDKCAMNKCKIIGCFEQKHAAGMCGKHWHRWKRNQPLNDKSVYEKTLIERFWEHVDKRTEKECWLWQGAKNGSKKIYGNLRINGKTQLAHRFSWIIANGPIPKMKGTDWRGTCVLHRCDNGLCVNPDHLFLGTHIDNMIDRTTKGRSSNKKKTHCPAGHEYSLENTYVSSLGGRKCKICTQIQGKIDRKSTRL